MRSVLMSAMLVAALGCSARRAPPVDPASRWPDGRYTFVATTPNHAVGGWIDVSEGETYVVFDPACPSRSARPPLPSNVRFGVAPVRSYQCGDAWLTFDLRTPSNAKWYVVQETRSTNERCNWIEWDGQRYCWLTRSGSVKVQRVIAVP